MSYAGRLELQRLTNCKKTDLSPSQAARLYKDEVEAISLSVLEKLCNTLKCSPDDVFGYNEPQTVEPQDT